MLKGIFPSKTNEIVMVFKRFKKENEQLKHTSFNSKTTHSSLT